LLTKHGRPVFVAVPVDEELVRNGVMHALAVKLFEERISALAQAAKVAGVPLETFAQDVTSRNPRRRLPAGRTHGRTRHPASLRRLVVADAGPLIALASIDHLRWRQRLYERAFAPEAALAECLVDPLPGSVAVRAAIDAGVIERADDPQDLDRPVLALDRGECATITLGRSLDADILTNEQRGRTVAPSSVFAWSARSASSLPRSNRRRSL
jgi:antitoxin (DNA-binding transcriptional repressor) of toxin-antitoxin stability system